MIELVVLGISVFFLLGLLIIKITNNKSKSQKAKKSKNDEEKIENSDNKNSKKNDDKYIIEEDIEVLKKMFRNQHLTEQEREKLEMEFIESQNPNIKIDKTQDFIDFNNTSYKSTEITKGSIDNKITPIKATKSKYKLDSVATKTKKLNIKKAKKLVKNMSPEMQFFIFTNIFDKK